MRTLLFSIIGIGLLLFAVWTVIDTFVLENNPPPPEEMYNLPEVPFAAGVTGTPTKVVQTPEGDVEMYDVRKIEYATTPGDGFYHFKGTVKYPDSGFNILYSEHNDSFAISVYSHPLELYHDYASQYFLELTGLSEREACKLNVFLSVPFDIDADQAGRDFELSFCPTAVKMKD